MAYASSKHYEKRSAEAYAIAKKETEAALAADRRGDDKASREHRNRSAAAHQTATRHGVLAQRSKDLS